MTSAKVYTSAEHGTCESGWSAELCSIKVTQLILTSERSLALCGNEFPESLHSKMRSMTGEKRQLASAAINSVLPVAAGNPTSWEVRARSSASARTTGKTEIKKLVSTSSPRSV